MYIYIYKLCNTHAHIITSIINVLLGVNPLLPQLYINSVTLTIVIQT